MKSKTDEIRDRFAGQIATAAAMSVVNGGGLLLRPRMKRIAKISYRMADVLVKERNRKIKKEKVRK